jgi:uncharacterized NAD-dependent epimerase/dehydratase family protein
MIEFPRPYLLFLADSTSPSACRTAVGLCDWCPADVMGQFALEGGSVDLGLPRFTPSAAAAGGARTMVIGAAAPGRALPPHWVPALVAALEAGLDLASGLETRLGSIPELAAAAARRGRELHDLRQADEAFATATGRVRSGRRALTVGMDDAVGMKYTALELARALRECGMPATFRATSESGIMISGGGVVIGAVAAHLIAGAAEWLSPDAAANHWDVIEGHGALFHPACGGVTLGLVHGSQPDAMVLCHAPQRTHFEGLPQHALPALESAIAQYLGAARVTNPAARFVGLSLDTSGLDEDRRMRIMHDLEGEFGMPVIDPMQGGAGRIAAGMLREFRWNAV